MKTHRVTLLTLVALLIFSPAWPGAAQEPAPDGPARQPPSIDAAPLPPEAIPQKAPDGRWFMPAGSRLRAATASAPQGSGGPDDFGYTWTDTVPLSWVNASGGTDTGINNGTDRAGPIDIGFPFKFYENTRSQLYISRSGFLTFNTDGLGKDQSPIPDPSSPNEVIAPYWVPVDTWGPEPPVDYVRYLRGGSAPNRWFVVEWNHVRGHCCNGDGTDEFTFETILHENGNIVFQYATMTTRGSSWCLSSGIEDTTGLDGLSTSPWCEAIASNHAVRITRPAPAARASLIPKAQGAFGAAGTMVQFDQTVRNTGEFGADTFDLAVSSAWPTSVYQMDGSTPLTDTDGDGTRDTGPIDQGGSTTIVVKTVLPAGAAAGDSNTAQVTAIPSNSPAIVNTARFQTAIPASFAQTYVSQASWMEPSRAMVGFYRPYQQITCQTPDQSAWGSVVATTPDGNIVQVWRQSRSNGNGQSVWELHYAVLDRRCNVIRSAARLTDLSAATTAAYELEAAVAVAPDGRIGITWRRRLWNSSNGTDNHNIYFLMLDGNGATVVPPANLTNNEGWGTSSTPNVPQFYTPTIAATADGRFGLAWYRQIYDGNSGTWYAVRGADGSQVKAPTQFSANARLSSPNLTALADGTLFLILAQRLDNLLGYSRIDRDGNIVTGLTTLSASNPFSPDAVQLSNGNIVLAWYNWSDSKYNIAYAVLNNGFGIVRGPTSLPNISPMYNPPAVSATRSKEWAVLTWLGAWGSQPNLGYALLDGSGNVLTPPMIFFSDCAGCSISLPSNGQGNTPLLEDLEVTGQVVNNRHQPIFNASVSATPALLNTAVTDGRGNYALFGATTGAHNLTAGRLGYSALPPIYGVQINGNLSGIDFVLPPEQDAMTNGGWEAGDLTGWEVGSAVTATVEAAAAHTGLGGLRLVSPPAGSPEPIWQVSQTITLPVNSADPTLSWLYRVASGTAAESMLVVVSDGSASITHTIPLAVVGWSHAWEDLSAFNGQTMTLHIGFQGTAGAREVHLDEISVGATRVGAYPVRLPLILRR